MLQTESIFLVQLDLFLVLTLKVKKFNCFWMQHISCVEQLFRHQCIWCTSAWLMTVFLPSRICTYCKFLKTRSFWKFLISGWGFLVLIPSPYVYFNLFFSCQYLQWNTLCNSESFEKTRLKHDKVRSARISYLKHVSWKIKYRHDYCCCIQLLLLHLIYFEVNLTCSEFQALKTLKTADQTGDMASRF